ncbi:hypothetical protein TREMEDRAFT_35402 [Tremella mesenterica DSM 1558]|uniref:uncharacterized protein n=1 Tax=Tremella mesenterica (strain ATCC 24925 / CBS 8224 / DSM 1558 / NBRC 9311 / NRRL Y-6157 / RJB 2259-6 / UBC 559-6) TaxID=578456 RepID=UPI00032CA358|nr:uncharacterized protein TREMEDRAFT_35402 [Tremella mesenterica DSM 1558]EIW66226.1 hypothetical protein TREMEDRAFT_35402 [Tremella mesenterica DSM 1558]
MAGKYDEEWLEREFVGYGYTSPDPKWPGGAKIAVNFLIQYNMGAELNPAEGDEYADGHLLEIPRKTPTTERSDMLESQIEFGAMMGVPRLLALFKKYNMPCTWNIYTRALEQALYWVKPILEAGHEMSLGGHRWWNNMDISPETEDELINLSIDKLQELTGDKTLPKGWFMDRRSNISTKLYSLAHSTRNLPLLYSSDSQTDDLPYYQPSLSGESEGLLMLPMSYDTSDWRFNGKGSGWASPKDFATYLIDTFDCLYAEGSRGEGRMMTVLLHPHIIGRATRTSWFEGFLKYISEKEGVWVATREEIANHWKETFPYDKKKAFGQTGQAPCGQIHFQ